MAFGQTRYRFARLGATIFDSLGLQSQMAAASRHGSREATAGVRVVYRSAYRRCVAKYWVAGLQVLDDVMNDLPVAATSGGFISPRLCDFPNDIRGIGSIGGEKLISCQIGRKMFGVAVTIRVYRAARLTIVLLCI